MKARYIQRGESIDYTPAVDVAAGDIVKVGELVGVAKLDIPSGTLGALALTGVYELFTDNAVVELGDEVSIDPATGKVCSAGATGAIKFGYAASRASAADASVLVRLVQGLG